MQKTSPVLPLCLLLTASLCLEAFSNIITFYLTDVQKTWAQARQYCQEHHVDLITEDAVDTSWLTLWMKEYSISHVWTGLVRDPDNESEWRWIDLMTGEGISGYKVRRNISWEATEQSPHCAYVKDREWYSAKCLEEKEVFCVENGQIQHYNVLRNWYQAARFCQAKGTDLAIINSAQENKNLLDRNKSGWIGLYRKGGDTWSWISGATSTYRYWATDQPLTSDCAAVDAESGKFYSMQCSREIPFVCYDDNLVLVKENKTWEEALDHCKHLKTPCDDLSGQICMYEHNLLSLNNLTGYYYSYLRHKIYRATSNEVWKWKAGCPAFSVPFLFI